MIKRAPTPKLLAVIAVFALSCFGLLLYLWLSFGGAIPLKPQGYRFKIAFPVAVQLAGQSDVRIAGVGVGKVIDVAPDPADNRTLATIELQRQFAPVPRDTRAILRLKSLLGETYVELTPGHRGLGLLPEGGRLADGQVSHTVEIDQILSTFKPSTRAAFRTWMQSQALAVKGRGADINAAFGTLPDFIDTSSRLLGTLDSQSAAVRHFISATGAFFAAISARQGELQGLITDSNHLFQTTAQRNRDLAAIFQALPRFERESRVTLPQLTAFGRRATPVVKQLQPVADAMTPTFQALEALAPQFRGFFARLGPVVSASKAGLPAFEQILRELPPLFSDFQPFLRNANPMVQYIGQYKHEVTSLFANTTAATLAHDNQEPRDPSANVHYLRTAQTLGPESLAFLPAPLGSTRQNAYLPPGALSELLQGLPTLDPSTCANPDPAPPTDAIPATLTALVTQYAFRTPDGGGNIARPPCRSGGLIPGFGTAFPQLRAEP
jgi:phospholipid/cholesterol/gamma-HCH transport system substrate-binding protein